MESGIAAPILQLPMFDEAHGMKRVLVAESDTRLLDYYGRILEFCGYEVATASDALQCLALLRGRDPDALVLDRELLWGGGDGVVARMREDFAFPQVPVLLLVAEGRPDGLSGLECPPVAACIPKPLRSHVLLQRVQSVVN